VLWGLHFKCVHAMDFRMWLFAATQVSDCVKWFLFVGFACTQDFRMWSFPFLLASASLTICCLVSLVGIWFA
jgi:hypothetical protein